MKILNKIINNKRKQLEDKACELYGLYSDNDYGFLQRDNYRNYFLELNTNTLVKSVILRSSNAIIEKFKFIFELNSMNRELDYELQTIKTNV